MKLLKSRFLLLLLLLSVLSLNGYSQKKKNNKSDATSSKSQDLTITSIFIDANKEKILGNFTQASILFAECIRRNPAHDASYFELSKIYFIQRDMSRAIDFAKKAIELNPKNEWYQLFLAQAYQATRNYKPAVMIYKNLCKLKPEEPEFVFNLATVYLMNNDLLEAVKTLDKLEKMIGISEELSIQKEKIYLGINKPKQAIAEIKKLTVAFPKEARYYGYLAELYMSLNKHDLAYQALQKVLEIDPDNPQIHLSLANYYRDKKDFAQSFLELKKAFNNVNLDVETKMKVLFSYYNITDSDTLLKPQAYELLTIMLDKHAGNSLAYVLYGDFLSRDKKYKEANDYFQLALQTDSSKYEIWEQILFNCSQINDFTTMNNISARAINLFPEQPLIYLFNGISSHQLKNYAEAAKIMEKGVKLVYGDNKLKAEFYKFMGDSYYYSKNREKSFHSYEMALIYLPDDEYILNNYSYFLAIKGEQLDKALKMSKRAVEKNPNSSSYLDTYGWVLYKSGNYIEAKEYILKAIENGGTNNPVLLEHLGDVYYKLNNTAKANEYWQKALEKGKGSDFLEQKVKDGILYE